MELQPLKGGGYRFYFKKTELAIGSVFSLT